MIKALNQNIKIGKSNIIKFLIKRNWTGFHCCILFLLVSNLQLQAQNNLVNEDFSPDQKLIYKTIDAIDLKLHVFNPNGHKMPDHAPVIIFFFGGGWSGGTPKQFYQQSRYFSEKGIVAISAEYRVHKTHGTTPFESVKDAKSAVRWVRQHANELGINPNKIVASGGSAGGHIAACTGVIEGYDEVGEDLTISSVPNAMILFNPVLDTTEKGYGMAKVGEKHKTDISPNHHVKGGIVPTLVFHGTADKTVPFENAERFAQLMKEAGNHCELERYEGKGHGFFNGTFFRGKAADTIVYVDILKKSLAFLKSQSIVSNLRDSVNFSYQEVSGIGVDNLYNRRDNSDIIKVGNKYYIWYTRMDSPKTSGYWGTIWYATSEDEGHTWKEQGMALGLGDEGEFDNHSVFTPNVLVHKGKYYLYYTGVKPTPGNVNKEFEGNSTTDITAIGLVVADSPDGPFVRTENNPVLEISNVASDFDSFRIDDTSLLVKDQKIWLYYKGRSIIHGKSGPGKTQMSVAYANTPEGPYKKHKGPLLDKSHEVLIWNYNGGVASLASINSSINFAPDGVHFSTLQDSLTNIPKAPGLYRPHLEDGHAANEIPGWGIAMKVKNGQVYLVRYEMK
jgi:acetyl esterase/lipase